MKRNILFITLVAWLLLVTFAACTTAELAKVQDASSKRDAICQFAKAWSPDTPELAKVQQACDAGDSLKEIAAAYAGCSELPTESDPTIE